MGIKNFGAKSAREVIDKLVEYKLILKRGKMEEVPGPTEEEQAEAKPKRKKGKK